MMDVVELHCSIMLQFDVQLIVGRVVLQMEYGAHSLLH